MAEALLPLGVKDGITLSKLNDEYRVTVFSIYDVYWPFSQAVRAGTAREVVSFDQSQIPYEARTKTYAFDAATIDSNPDKALWLDKTINDQRAVHIERGEEMRDQRMQVVALKAEEWTAKSLGVRWVHGLPYNGFLNGEVLHAGKYNVAFQGGVKDGEQYVQIVPTANLLSGADFNNRLESSQQKFPVGQSVYVSFNDKTHKASTVRLSSEKAPEREAQKFEGVLVSHGDAPFNNEPDNKPSYFVTLEKDGQEITKWGVDLKRALRVSEANVGDELSLSRRSSTGVVVKNGEGKEQETYRTTWDVAFLNKEQSPQQQPAKNQEADLAKAPESEGKLAIKKPAAKKAPKKKQEQEHTVSL